ncbi:CPBP family intramembrane metalloprotease [Staphylococcus chromogenes]|nr:CPBP family intramembrane metalloprotease [Staphylococcus chromogenes]PTF68318.1 CPBP family intramembrane metalloprotease [Staphylococcus chromogenes]PTG81893.1 CPBP family intramembrane metalloprotease [Staphylococcus chromogenes]PUZ18764.1 CPBP family intramembrane metalloprotease [Staphylococcus chromogenes]TRL27093.1 CPBP family intramembrane metalloprotease [Staphylococcus chromogenes]
MHMKKHYLFLALYMFVMGLGLIVTKHVFNTSYESEHFGQTFLPFMTILAVMSVIYGLRNKSTIALASTKKHGWLFILPFITITLLWILTMVENVNTGLMFILPMIDAILIGIAEEGAFRGIILGGLARRMKPIYAVFLSAVLFAALHLLNVLGGVTMSDVLNQMLSTFLMGIFLGAVYIYTRNIFYPIFFHFAWDYVFLNNGLGAVSFAPMLFIGTVVLEVLVIVWILWKMRHVQTLEPKSDVTAIKQ